ncbi:hypothetical protein [Hyalangium sp.]|uniref:hypothetical protein n=1 Tax=Hyalangium sp. TaxID=2028555 RepID=UPI002D5E5C6C|nr:hypothetical protein [Hyalangium sp.]HYI00300.1 hypothetical protein [Hyalangium sp.]
MRTLPVPQVPWKALLAVLSLCLALPLQAQAQTQSKTQTKTKARKPKPQPQKPKPPEKEEAPSEKPQSVVQAEERAQAKSRMRVGVGLELFKENSHLAGSQSINASRTDESFDYSSATFLSATLSLSIPAPILAERARIGGAVRLFGNYSASGNRQFGFGLLSQAFITGEYGLPVADKTEVMFGGRVGMSLLVPDRELSQEIDRLQVQGVGVWSVPRVGWLGGLSLGGRRKMSERIHLRADLSAQLDKTYLFATNETIEGLEFSKSWSTSALRFGFTVGAEFSL